MKVMAFLMKDFLVPNARLLVESVWNGGGVVILGFFAISI
jgi:hypothetical protein